MLSIKNLRIQSKLLLIIGSALLGVVTLVSMSLMFLKQDLMRERELTTRHMVESAHSLLVFHQKMAADGKVSPEEAKAMAVAALRAMRYGENQYFWINDLKPSLVMHPFKSQLEGQNVAELKDAAGKKFVAEAVQTVQAHGSGFVFYVMDKPGSEKPVRKVSYVKGFVPWGWVVGSGVYLDDVDVIFWQSARHYALAGVLVFLVISASSLAVAGNIARTEESLRLSKEKFYKAFHASPDGYTISRKKDGCYFEANDTFLHSTGYSRDEVIGHTAMELGLWAEPAQRSMLIQRMEQEGKLRNLEVTRRTKSGEMRSVLCSCDAITLKGEECLLVIEHDITSQKEKERQLLQRKAELTVQHEQLTSLFQVVELTKRDWERTMDCIDDHVIMLDGEGRVKRCNRSTARFTGLPKGKIIGLDWRQLTRSAGMPELGPGERHAEFYHEPLERWYSCTYYPGDADGSGERGSVITIHDMTESKRAAMELGQAYAELKLTQSHMLQQEKMASIGQLAAGVAHEINNPTGFVMSNLATLGKYSERLIAFLKAQGEALGAAGPGAQAAEMAALRRQLKIDHIIGDLPGLIGESLEGTERVKTIVQNLKSFSRTDDSALQPADLRDCIESTINIVWNELKYKAVLKRDFADLPPVLCYPQQLNQVIMNLLVNAAHAIEGQGEVTVRTWQDGTSAYIAVSDTGCGIAEKHRARIFEPFFTTKEVGKGTGLGLSISFNIVKKHGGEISVESEPGKGSTFTIALPLKEKEAA